MYGFILRSVGFAGRPAGIQTPHVPPYPTATIPPSTMTGTFLDPLDSFSILSMFSGEALTFTYSTS